MTRAVVDHGLHRFAGMRWDRGHKSSHVEDRRGQPGPVGAGGIGALLPLAARFGWKGIVVVLLLLGGLRAYACMSKPAAQRSAVSSAGAPPTTDELGAFVGFVHDDVQSFWQREFEAAGRQYEVTTLVLFTGTVQSGCGVADSQVGPFYCPEDHRVFIDLGFYDDLRQRFGAPGDFAQAYVLAHELGHHVQNLLGVFKAGGGNAASVAIELQADCLAGVWAPDAQRRDLPDIGDSDAALTAASTIGDDTLQRQAGGAVRPESWTHGSSAQRHAALEKGFESGDPAACGLDLRR
jgi:predicted metalloprotease